MIEITVDDVLDEIDEIGMAFSNDMNDGEGPFTYSGFGIDYNVYPPLLRFSGTDEEGEKHEFTFELREVTE